jgi:hypothetical protein
MAQSSFVIAGRVVTERKVPLLLRMGGGYGL